MKVKLRPFIVYSISESYSICPQPIRSETFTTLRYFDHALHADSDTDNTVYGRV